MMNLAVADLRALILAAFLFPLSLSFVPRQDKYTTPAPTEESYTSENNKPTAIRHINYPIMYPFALFDAHVPMFRIPAYPPKKNLNFGIEPHLRVSGRKKRSMSLGRYFFVQRMMPPQVQDIEYNNQQKEVEPCNGTANENCTDEVGFALDKKQPSWQVDKRANIPAVPSSPINIKARRPYDVPQIECPPAKDGTERFACPSPDHTNRYRCIDDHSLCDGFIDCPNAEDEDMGSCMFYKTTKAHLDVLADALLRWARGRY